MARRSDSIGSADDGRGAALHVLAPVVIVVVTQATNPGSIGQLLLLLHRGGIDAPRAAPQIPGGGVRGRRRGAGGSGGRPGRGLEGAFFLGVMMVLNVARTVGSTVRAVLIAVLAGGAPWVVSRELVPEETIGWHPWAMAAAFTFFLGRTLRRQRAHPRAARSTTCPRERGGR